MACVVRRTLAAFLCTVALAATPLQAQNADQKPAERGKGEAAKDGAGRVDDVVLTGPAARDECVWLGTRAVGLMWRDDLDTAFRHLDLYDRFGCPGEHIQMSFRCVVRQGEPDQKDQKDQKGPDFNTRVRWCWNNPALPPAAVSAATEKPGTK
jgi:hypothetical protein